jgi:hypothetical protein
MGTATISLAIESTFQYRQGGARAIKGRRFRRLGKSLFHRQEIWRNRVRGAETLSVHCECDIVACVDLDLRAQNSKV